MQTLDHLKNRVDYENKGTFQNALYLKRLKYKLHDLDELLKEEDETLAKLIHFSSIRDPSAGKWLSTLCRFKQYELYIT